MSSFSQMEGGERIRAIVHTLQEEVEVQVREMQKKQLELDQKEKRLLQIEKSLAEREQRITERERGVPVSTPSQIHNCILCRTPFEGPEGKTQQCRGHTGNLSVALAADRSQSLQHESKCIAHFECYKDRVTGNYFASAFQYPKQYSLWTCCGTCSSCNIAKNGKDQGCTQGHVFR